MNSLRSSLWRFKDTGDVQPVLSPYSRLESGAGKYRLFIFYPVWDRPIYLFLIIHPNYQTMPKHYQVKIDNPCHEDWDKMTPQDQGRFCGSCQKQVVDFTSMSDAQITAFFRKKTTGSVCGRFMNDQLDRDMVIPKKRIPWIKYFFQFTLPLFLTTMKLNAQTGKAMIMGKIKPPTENRPLIGDTILQQLDPIIEEQQPLPISGKVTSDTGDPIPYARRMK